MIFTESAVEGALIIDLEQMIDERGFFARTWCQREFAARGLTTQFLQCNLSYNRVRHTLRGMHIQLRPHMEAKLVRCTRGAIYDVIIDVRPQSSTYLRHFGVVLSAENRRALYVPEGCAHGFLTLVDESEVSYQMSAFHEPRAACGVRWDDPAFGIEWPAPVAVISERDRSYADFNPQQLEETLV
jgi:dTDP-4-dehydrorhamnose 3,5-epimerase